MAKTKRQLMESRKNKRLAAAKKAELSTSFRKKLSPKADASFERMPVFELKGFAVKAKSPFRRGTARHTAHHKMYSRRRGLIA